MIDRPVSPAGNVPATFSPLVRAVIDSVTEGVVIFDQQGRLLYANTSARRVIDGQNGDVRNRLQSLGARFAPLKNGAQSLGEAAILPPAGALTLAERERQAIADTLVQASTSAETRTRRPVVVAYVRESLMPNWKKQLPKYRYQPIKKNSRQTEKF